MTPPEVFRRRSAPTTVHAAVEGIAQACIPQPDQMLYDLLAAAIDECAVWADPAPGQGTSCGIPPLTPPPRAQNTGTAH